MTKYASLSRRATNISLDTALLEEAKALDINISRACERGLAESVAQARTEQWRLANAAALESSNRYVEDHGLPLSALRQF